MIRRIKTVHEIYGDSDSGKDGAQRSCGAAVGKQERVVLLWVGTSPDPCFLICASFSWRSTSGVVGDGGGRVQLAQLGSDAHPTVRRRRSNLIRSPIMLPHQAGEGPQKKIEVSPKHEKKPTKQQRFFGGSRLVLEEKRERPVCEE